MRCVRCLLVILSVGCVADEKAPRDRTTGSDEETPTSPVVPTDTIDTAPPHTEESDPWDVVTTWHWPGWGVPDQNPGKNIFSPPAVGQLDDDDGDGDIDEADVPDVVVSAFSAGGVVHVLVALDGRDGSPLWGVEGFTDQGSSVAVADVVGNDVPEVLFLDDDGRLVARTNEGDVRWRSDEPVAAEPYNGDPIVVADLDGDGTAEILVSAAIVDGRTGTVETWLPLVPEGERIQCVRPVVADLDQDGAAEIIAGHRVFAADGSLRFEAPVEPPDSRFPYRSVVVQADADPSGEVLFYGQDATQTQLAGWVLEADGTVSGSFDVPEDEFVGVPCVGDVDHDGIAEVIRPGSGRTWVGMELDGTELWRVSVPNDLGSPGCTLGDIDGDGALEVLVTGGGLAILDAATGQVRFGPMEIGYGLQWGGGAMVDLDRDGSMELVVGANDYASGMEASASGVIVLSHASGAWAPGAPSWPTSSHTAGAFDPMGQPLAPTAWWLGDHPYPGP